MSILSPSGLLTPANEEAALGSYPHPLANEEAASAASRLPANEEGGADPAKLANEKAATESVPVLPANEKAATESVPAVLPANEGECPSFQMRTYSLFLACLKRELKSLKVR